MDGIGVYHCSPTNSTFFTNCCGCAITDSEKVCPKCKQEVIGYDYDLASERHSIRWNCAFRRRR